MHRGSIVSPQESPTFTHSTPSPSRAANPVVTPSLTARLSFVGDSGRESKSTQPQGSVALYQREEIENPLEAVIQFLDRLGLSSQLRRDLVERFCAEPPNFETITVTVRAILNRSNTMLFMEFYENYHCPE